MNLWIVIFPLLLISAAFGRPRAVYVYMLVTVVWVTAVTNLIEIGENDRMRLEIEPFLVVFLAGALSRASLLLRRLKRT